MKIVIPIAGRGSKFTTAGYKEPKPLINIKGQPMIKWTTDALPLLSFDKKTIFIVLKKHVDQFSIDKKLRELYGDKVTILISEEITEGAACTVLLAKNLINDKKELVIYNGDQYFKNSIENLIKTKKRDIKGIIPVFRATHSRWSYVLLDKDGYVVKTAEKEVISNLATVGLYYFKHGADFVWAAERMIEKDIRVQGEFYVCPVYNELIQRGDKIIASEVKEMWSFATPEDLEHFEKYFKNDFPKVKGGGMVR